MEDDRRALRREAARAFLESLDQFQDSLVAAEATTDGAKSEVSHLASLPNPTGSRPTTSRPNSTVPTTKPRPINNTRFTIAELEDAVADIEQFMRSRSLQEPER